MTGGNRVGREPVCHKWEGAEGPQRGRQGRRGHATKGHCAKGSPSPTLQQHHQHKDGDTNQPHHHWVRLMDTWVAKRREGKGKGWGVGREGKGVPQVHTHAHTIRHHNTRHNTRKRTAPHHVPLLWLRAFPQAGHVPKSRRGPHHGSRRWHPCHCCRKLPTPVGSSPPPPQRHTRHQQHW
jgi:hypothetical protein